jgi:hypothetical protein
MDVEIESHRIIITDWVITDPDVVGFVSQLEPDEGSPCQQYSEMLLRALRVGVLSIGQAQATVNVDSIRREFDSMQRDLTDALDSVFRADSGKLALALNTYLGEGGKLSDLFDPSRKTSAIGRIQEIFDRHFGGNGEFVRLLDYTEPDSPLRKLHVAFDKRINELQERIIQLQKQQSAEEARAEERELGTQKGFDFEDTLEGMLGEISRPFGDVVTRVGGEASIGRMKKGDLLVQVHENEADGRDVRILIESKREKGKSVTGRTGILQEMEDGMRTRGAHFAIAVFSEDACPGSVGRLRSYSGNRLICSVPPDLSDRLTLEIAYRLARTEACWQARHEGRGIDASRVRQAVEQARDKLDQFRGLKQGLTELVKSAKAVRDNLDDIENEMRCQLNRILAELVEGDEAVNGTVESMTEVR